MMNHIVAKRLSTELVYSLIGTYQAYLRQQLLQVKQLMAQLKEGWQGSQYNVLTKNCNHFCQELALKLGINGIPGENLENGLPVDLEI